MRAWAGRGLALLFFAVAPLLLLLADPAGGDVVEPPGACVGQGTWQDAGFNEESTEHQPGDTIKVPRSDTVFWEGNLRGGQPGGTTARRPIEGEVEIQLPAPFGWLTIEDWGGTSVKVANEGEEEYDLPNVLAGTKMKLRGEHREDGELFCRGEINVEVEGSISSNPLLYGSIGGLVISGGALLFAGRPVFKKLWAFEDHNPG